MGRLRHLSFDSNYLGQPESNVSLPVPDERRAVSELVVFVFRDQYRAPEVLNELRRREWPWIRDLDDAVAITLNGKGKARVHMSVDLSTCEAVNWARLWGSLLSTTLFLPLTDMMVEAVKGISVSAGMRAALPTECSSEFPEKKWWRDTLHLSENFTRDVAALIAPGGSAIFMLLRAATVPVALEQLRNYGDTIIHTSLNTDQDDKMFAMLTH
jgi:uncharacterized membrane protein